MPLLPKHGGTARDVALKVNYLLNQTGLTVTWGGIGGTLADQTDLQAALDGKLTVVDGGGAYAGYPKYVAETGLFVENAAGDRAFLAVDSGDLGSLYCENTDTSAWLLVGGTITANGIAFNSSHAIDFGTGLLCSSVSGLGYATGAGGTQTQNTSKSQGVTLNKACGQITMNTAALAAGAKVFFTVTNNKVAATDTILVNVASGGTTDAYRAWISKVAAGSFKIGVENVTAGSLSESPVINFALIRGASA